MADLSFANADKADVAAIQDELAAIKASLDRNEEMLTALIAIALIQNRKTGYWPEAIKMARDPEAVRKAFTRDPMEDSM